MEGRRELWDPDMRKRPFSIREGKELEKGRGHLDAVGSRRDSRTLGPPDIAAAPLGVWGGWGSPTTPQKHRRGERLEGRRSHTGTGRSLNRNTLKAPPTLTTCSVQSSLKFGSSGGS